MTTALLLSTSALSQTPASGDTQDLAKQLSNPVADLVSVPFQLNWDFGVGPDDDLRTILNFQPVMPFSVNEKLNVIARVIVPVISQPALESGASPTFGFGDILASFFFSPAQSKTLRGASAPPSRCP